MEPPDYEPEETQVSEPEGAAESPTGYQRSRSCSDSGPEASGGVFGEEEDGEEKDGKEQKPFSDREL